MCVVALVLSTWLQLPILVSEPLRRSIGWPPQGRCVRCTHAILVANPTILLDLIWANPLACVQCHNCHTSRPMHVTHRELVPCMQPPAPAAAACKAMRPSTATCNAANKPNREHPRRACALTINQPVLENQVCHYKISGLSCHIKSHSFKHIYVSLIIPADPHLLVYIGDI